MYQIFSVLALGFAVIVVSSSNTIYSLIYLIALFLTVAALLIAQGITYVGLLYIVVYVGAIAILFIFVVMIINVRDAELNTTGSNYTKSFPLTVLLGTIFIYLISLGINDNAGAINLGVLTVPLSKVSIGWQNFAISYPIWDSEFTSTTIVQAIGISLYTWGSLWLILGAAILLLCIVGPIALTLRTRD